LTCSVSGGTLDILDIAGGNGGPFFTSLNQFGVYLPYPEYEQYVGLVNGNYTIFAKNNSQQSGSSSFNVNCITTTTTTLAPTTTTTSTTTTTTKGPSNVPTGGLQLYLDATTPVSYTSGSSVWYDLSGNGFNIGLTGSYLYATNSINFLGGGWGYLSGSRFNSASIAPLQLNNTTSSLSVVSFFNTAYSPILTDQAIVSLNRPSAGGWQMVLASENQSGSKQFGFDILGSAPNGGGRVFKNEVPIWTSGSKWMMEAAVWDGSVYNPAFPYYVNQSQLYLYSNGVSGSVPLSNLGGTGQVYGTATTNGGLYIAGRDGADGVGTFPIPGELYDGKIGLVLVYNRVLTPAEISSIYTTFSSSFTN
jgi:hypothetical protein